MEENKSVGEGFELRGNGEGKGLGWLSVVVPLK